MRHFRLTPLRLAAALAVGSLVFAGVAYAATLGIGSGKLDAWNQSLTKGSCNQTSATAADTYVSQGHATTNYGTAATLQITGGTTAQAFAFVTLDLSGCSLPTTGGADSANLTLFVTSQQGHTIALYPVYSSWSETGLTWNGLGGLTIGSTATTSFTPTKNQAYTVPVTADIDAAIKAGTLWGWELVDITPGAAKTTQIASAENGTVSRRPTLTLSYEK